MRMIFRYMKAYTRRIASSMTVKLLGAVTELMIPYILADNPGMNWKEASQISRRMMTGQKWNAFVLDLSFLGWFLLDYFTFGILGVLMVNPYYEATLAELYAYNKSQAYQEGYIR